MDRLEIHQRKRRAMAYLATLPNYRLQHRGKTVELEHLVDVTYGPYGVSGKEWKVVETIEFWRVK